MAYTKLKHPVFATGTYTDGQAPTYTGGVVVGKLMNANLSYTQADAKLYGDDALVMSDISVTGGDITMQVTHLLPAVEAAMLGMVAGSGENSTEYSLTDNVPPYGGFGYVRGGTKDDGTAVYTAYWLWRTTWAMSGENATTRGDQTEYQTPELKGTMMAAQIDNTGKSVFYTKKDFTTESAAIAYINGKAGIS